MKALDRTSLGISSPSALEAPSTMPKIAFSET